MTTVLEWGEGSASRPGRSLPPGKTRYSMYRRLRGLQGRSGEARKVSPPTGIRSPDHPARSQSLYRLRYPAHHSDSRHDNSEYCHHKVWYSLNVFFLTTFVSFYVLNFHTNKIKLICPKYQFHFALISKSE
jgi:hypothetical protein